MWSFWRLSLLSAFLLISDQVSKGTVQGLYQKDESFVLAPPFFSIVHRQSWETFFGFEIEPNFFLIYWGLRVMPIMICLGMLFLLGKYREKKDRINLAYALIFTGVFGNWIDRVSLGYVVDFIKIEVNGFFLLVFNISDFCLIVAGFLFVWSGLGLFFSRYNLLSRGGKV